MAEDVNKYFSKHVLQMAKRHLKRMLNTANRYRNGNRNYSDVPSHTRLTGYHQKDHRQQMLVRMWRRGNPSTLLVGCTLVLPLWEAIWRVLKKTKEQTKMELPYDPAILLLSM